MPEQSFAVYRHEDKYLLSPAEAVYLRGLLRGVLTPDAHGDYAIRSLYFDTPDLRDYNEKLLGLRDRKKLRLRTYSGRREDPVKLEIKNKSENLSHKETLVITSQEAESLIRGEWEVLDAYQSTTARRFQNFVKNEGRRPTMLIDYEREAFLCPAQRVRITFDKHIRAAHSDAFFDPHVPMVGLHSGQITVLEVKYDSFLPAYLSRLLSSCCLQHTSVSKYSTACEFCI